MDVIISSLLNRFERGAVTRRELIQALTMLSVAGSGPSQAQGQTPGIKATKIDHVSIQVNDLPRSVASPEGRGEARLTEGLIALRVSPLAFLPESAFAFAGIPTLSRCFGRSRPFNRVDGQMVKCGAIVLDR